LWEPLCYAQIGGLTIATGVTLLLVPVLYALFVIDLKWISWPVPTPAQRFAQQREPTIARRIPAGITEQIRKRIPEPSDDHTLIIPPPQRRK
jgi:hypothetical protein